MAAVVPSVRITKRFTFKNTLHEWSNRYYFHGGVPSNATNWHALMDALTNIEKTMWDAATTILMATGYEAGSDVPVASKAYSLGGTLSSTGLTTPGECAALLRMATDGRSTKNHPIYCFSYYHGAKRNSTSDHQDELAADQRTAIGVYGAAWVSGITAGGITATRSSPQGHSVTGYLVEEYITHRDFRGTTSV